MSNFEVVDRRGSKKAETLTIIEEPLQIHEQSGDWKSIGYLVILVPAQGGSIVAGRAVGIRSDGEGPYVADYFFTPVWPEHLDWIKEVRKRLDTFLGCECRHGGHQCAIHKMYLPQWLQADTQRLQMGNNTPLPEPVELLIKAERAMSERKIVVPRG